MSAIVIICMTVVTLSFASIVLALLKLAFRVETFKAIGAGLNVIWHLITDRTEWSNPIMFHDLAPPGYFPTPRLMRRPVSETNFDDWTADPRTLTFQEYMEEMVPDHRLPTPPKGGTGEIRLPEYTGQVDTGYMRRSYPVCPPNHRIP